MIKKIIKIIIPVIGILIIPIMIFIDNIYIRYTDSLYEYVYKSPDNLIDTDPGTWLMGGHIVRLRKRIDSTDFLVTIAPNKTFCVYRRPLSNGNGYIKEYIGQLKEWKDLKYLSEKFLGTAKYSIAGKTLLVHWGIIEGVRSIQIKIAKPSLILEGLKVYSESDYREVDYKEAVAWLEENYP